MWRNQPHEVESVKEYKLMEQKMGKREKNFERVRQGQTYSIKTAIHTGHKGLVVKKHRNGTLEVEVFTHHPYTRGRKNIKLQENPQKNDSADSYALSKIQRVSIEKAGKHQGDMVIRNKVDKSVRRNLQRKGKLSKK